MTHDDPSRYRRRSIRLAGYDYAQAGAYFLTVCTFKRECLFGEVVAGSMVLNPAGYVVAEEWVKTAAIRAEIELDEWVVMPNHIHGIVMIRARGGDVRIGRRGDRPVAPTSSLTRPVAPTSLTRPVAPTSSTRPIAATSTRPIAATSTRPVALAGPRPKSIGALVAGFKSAATRRLNQLRETPGAAVWQRNYYEHIIRDESSLYRIRAYIAANPARWSELPRTSADPQV
jgi:REP element-mobilizing transposase RayT